MPLVMGGPWQGGYFGSLEFGIAQSGRLTDGTGGWTANTPASLPLIPGGAGWGMLDNFGGSGRHSLVGGRARVRVVFVKNLSTSGTESLKNSLQLSDGGVARTIVPSISGLVNMGFRDPINIIRNQSGDDFLTYAGQCAPDQGLFTQGSGIGIFTDDVLIWHHGTLTGKEIGPVTQDGQAISIASGILNATSDTADNILIANCSILYAKDEGMSTSPAASSPNFPQRNVGFWQCSLTHPLQLPYGPSPPAGHGMLHAPAGTNALNATDGLGELRNFYAHILLRQPLAYSVNMDLQNNLYYHFAQGVQYQSRNRVIKHNCHGALFIGLGGEQAVNRYDGPFASGSQVHLGDFHKIGSITNIVTTGNQSGLTQVGSPITSALSPGYNKTVITPTTPGFLTYATLVTDHAGVKPTLRLQRIQDSVDHCINKINDTTPVGGFINTEDDVGGMPTLTSSLVDHEVAGSHNGNMAIPQPDANKVSFADGWRGDYDIMASGYTRLEEWTHHMNDLCMPSKWDE